MTIFTAVPILVSPTSCPCFIYCFLRSCVGVFYVNEKRTEICLPLHFALQYGKLTITI